MAQTPTQAPETLDWEERIREWLKELPMEIIEKITIDDIIEALKEWAEKRPTIVEEGWYQDCYTYVVRHCRGDDCYDREWCVRMEIELPLHKLSPLFTGAVLLITPAIAIVDAPTVRVRRYG